MPGVGYRFVALGGGRPPLELGDRRVDLERMEVVHGTGERTTLSANEARILELLEAAGGRPVAAEGEVLSGLPDPSR